MPVHDPIHPKFRHKAQESIAFFGQEGHGINQSRVQLGDTAGFTLDGVDHFGTVLKITDFGVTIDAATMHKPVDAAWVDVIVLDSPVEVPVVEDSPEPVIFDAAQISPIEEEIQEATPVVEDTVSAEPECQPPEGPTEEIEVLPQLDSVGPTRRAEIDAILIQSGFDPGIDYIKANYGSHWCKREADIAAVLDSTLPTTVIPQAPDFSPVLDGFRQAISDLASAQASQISSLTSAIALLAEKSNGSNDFQPPLIASLISALNEARKPMDINLKLEMPEQKTKRFVAEKDASGRMTLSEVPQ